MTSYPLLESVFFALLVRFFAMAFHGSVSSDMVFYAQCLEVVPIEAEPAHLFRCLRTFDRYDMVNINGKC